MDDEEKSVVLRTISRGLMGVTLGLMLANCLRAISDTKESQSENETYTVCYAGDEGYLIKTGDLKEYSDTEAREVILTNSAGSKVVYYVDEVLVIGQYENIETAQTVLDIINQYEVVTELPSYEREEAITKSKNNY